MVEITRTLQGVACDRHVLPPARRVGPGLRSIPVPIPGNPRRHVLVYALELARGVVIINAGWSTDDAREALCGLRQARGWSVAVGNQARAAEPDIRFDDGHRVDVPGWDLTER